MVLGRQSLNEVCELVRTHWVKSSSQNGQRWTRLYRTEWFFSGEMKETGKSTCTQKIKKTTKRHGVQLQSCFHISGIHLCVFTMQGKLQFCAKRFQAHCVACHFKMQSYCMKFEYSEITWFSCMFLSSEWKCWLHFKRKIYNLTRLTVKPVLAISLDYSIVLTQCARPPALSVFSVFLRVFISLAACVCLGTLCSWQLTSSY